jgi:D-beta-D-heptose 7-phosphate kinase/D-beta-D-heptose 1-phosphate adenosyltransferase
MAFGGATVKLGDKWLEEFSKFHVLVVGDLMLDDYRRGHVKRISPEAPVPILSVVGKEKTLGGAGNVVRNLRSLNVSVSVIGVLGQDETGADVLTELASLSVNQSGIIRDSQRISTRKIRYVSVEHGQQVFRADEESSHAVTGKVEADIIHAIRDASRGAQVILCSDYLKGVLSARVLQAAFQAGRDHKIPVVVAPKDSNPSKYDGASILMPNLRELGRLVASPVNGDAWLTESAKLLITSHKLEALVVTRGSEGMSLFEMADREVQRVDIPTVARNVYDVTGAGDTAIATFAAAIASGADRETAAHLANTAAGIVVGKHGTATVTVEELQDHLIEQELHTPRAYRQRSSEANRPVRESSKA